MLIKLSLVSLSILLLGCASSSPVVYQNRGAPPVSEDVLRNDIAACESEARSKGLNSSQAPGSEVARDTVRGGAVGGATGAVGGAIGGNAGRGAKYGAAAGATAGLIRSIFKDSGSKPNATYRKYVERCLTDLGHDVIGWN